MTGTLTAVAAMDPLRRWQDIDPADAAGIDLRERSDITAPLNELGERCPWPWEPQQLIGAPLAPYGCPFCGALVLGGRPHIDYAYAPTGAPARGPVRCHRRGRTGEIEQTPAAGRRDS